jgi:hypothetical protein
MTKMTQDERNELYELRAYKARHEGKAINRSFARLEQLLEMSHYDPAISIRAFRVIAECLICLKEEIK